MGARYALRNIQENNKRTRIRFGEKNLLYFFPTLDIRILWQRFLGPDPAVFPDGIEYYPPPVEFVSSQPGALYPEGHRFNRSNAGSGARLHTFAETGNFLIGCIEKIPQRVLCSWQDKEEYQQDG